MEVFSSSKCIVFVFDGKVKDILQVACSVL